MRILLPLLILAGAFYLKISSAAEARTVVILVPGGKGAPHPSGFLMRNKHQFDRAGFETQIASSARRAIQLAETARKRGQEVFMVGMSIVGAGTASDTTSGTRSQPSIATIYHAGAARNSMMGRARSLSHLSRLTNRSVCT